jgi:hypothetical protein
MVEAARRRVSRVLVVGGFKTQKGRNMEGMKQGGKKLTRKKGDIKCGEGKKKSEVLKMGVF